MFYLRSISINVDKQSTKTHHRKLKWWAKRIPQKTGDEPRCSWRV